MKRVKGTWDIIVSDENLLEAINDVNSTHRWKKHHQPNKTVQWVESDIPQRIRDLRKILENGFVQATPKKKMRWDKAACKWREIAEPPIWPDQYIHHALVQAIKPVMMRGMDPFACSSIKHRGNSFGQSAVKKWMQKDPKGTKYAVELDIHHCYQDTPPEAVMDRMRRLIKDYKTLDLIWRIIKDGIVVGGYPSQWLMNTFLQPLDHEIREGGWSVTHYLRNMDNFLIFGTNRRKLKRLTVYIKEWLGGYGITLNDTGQVFATKDRDPQALGYRYNREYTLLKKKNLLRLKRQAARYYKKKDRGEPVPAKQAQSFMSRISMLKHCDSCDIRRRHIRKGTEHELKRMISIHDRKESKKWNTSSEPTGEKKTSKQSVTPTQTLPESA